MLTVGQIPVHVSANYVDQSNTDVYHPISN